MNYYLSNQQQRGASSTTLLLVLVGVIALTIGITLQTRQTQKAQEIPSFERIILIPSPRALSDFSLVDHHSAPFVPDSVKGRWSLLFFGFTHCPDICPTTLLALKNVRRELESLGQWPDLNVIMVSVDPERDTPARLAQYVPFFHPEFKGVTGSVDAVTEFAKEVGILFVQKPADDAGFYDVDHGVSMILLDPNGHYAGVITAPHEEHTLKADLAKFGQYLSNNYPDYASTPSPAQSEVSNNLKAQSSANSINAQSQSFGLQISDAWIRNAPSNARSHAGYLSLHNSTAEPITVEGLSSPAFNAGMIHSTSIENGIATMNHLDALVIPAQTTITLEPMGTHLMLMEARQSFIVGEQVPLTLKSSAGDVEFTARVLDSAPNG